MSSQVASLSSFLKESKKTNEFTVYEIEKCDEGIAKF